MNRSLARTEQSRAKWPLESACFRSSEEITEPLEQRVFSSRRELITSGFYRLFFSFLRKLTAVSRLVARHIVNFCEFIPGNDLTGRRISGNDWDEHVSRLAKIAIALIATKRDRGRLISFFFLCAFPIAECWITR